MTALQNKIIRNYLEKQINECNLQIAACDYGKELDIYKCKSFLIHLLEQHKKDILKTPAQPVQLDLEFNKA